MDKSSVTCFCPSLCFYDSCSYSYLFSLLCNIPLAKDIILLLREVLGHFQCSATLKSVLINFSNVALGAFAQEFPWVKLLVPVCVSMSHMSSSFITDTQSKPLESGVHLMELMASHVQSTYWIPSVPEWGLKDPSTLWTTISILSLLHFLLDKAAKEHNWTWMSSSWKNYQRCRTNNGNTVRNSLVVQWLGLCTSTARGSRDWTKLLGAAKNKQTKKDGGTVKVEQSSGGWPRCAMLTASLHQWMSGNWNSQGTNTQ